MLGDIGYNCDMPLTKREFAPWLWAAAATVLLLMPLPLDAANARWPALTQALQNFGHPLVFAWLAHVVFARLRTRMPRPSPAPWLWVLAGALGYGAATEIAQAQLGRSASVTDLANDLLGAGFALLLHWRSEQAATSGRRALAAMAVMVAGVAAAPLALTTTAYVYRSAREPLLWKADDALFAVFSYRQGGRFTGLAVVEPLPDWTGWNQLQVEVENLQPEELPLVVRVNDRRHNQRYRDRYNGTFALPPLARQTLRIPLEQIRTMPASRQLDLERVDAIVVFSMSRDQPRRFKVHEIRLAR